MSDEANIWESFAAIDGTTEAIEINTSLPEAYENIIEGTTMRCQEPKPKVAFETGMQVKVLSCEHGGLGHLFHKGDIGIIVSMTRAVVNVEIDNNNYNFGYKDLEIITSMSAREQGIEAYVSRAVQQYRDIPKILAKQSKDKRDILLHSKSRFEADIRRLNQEINNANILYRSTAQKAYKSKDYEADVILMQFLLTKHYEKIVISAEEPYMFGYTKPIVINYKHDNHPSELSGDYHLGQYKVELHLDTGNLHILSTEENGTRDGYQHPHISDNGDCCLGTYAPVVDDYLAKGLFLDALVVIHDYLSSVYPDDWYYPLMAWHKNADDYCHECWYSPCDCGDKCVECNNHIDACGGTKCPNSGEIMPDGFPDDYCLDCDTCHREGDDYYACHYNGSNHPVFET